MDGFVNFGDTRSHRTRDIRAAHFVMDDDGRRLRPTDHVVIGRMPCGVSPLKTWGALAAALQFLRSLAVMSDAQRFALPQHLAGFLVLLTMIITTMMMMIKSSEMTMMNGIHQNSQTAGLSEHRHMHTVGVKGAIGITF